MVGVLDIIIKFNFENIGFILEWDNYDLREDVLDDSVSSSLVYVFLLVSSFVRKNFFCFGELIIGFNFSFKFVLSLFKFFVKLN